MSTLWVVVLTILGVHLFYGLCLLALLLWDQHIEKRRSQPVDDFLKEVLGEDEGPAR